MAMPSNVFRCTLTLPKMSKIPADAVNWDFHFRHAAGAPVDADFDNMQGWFQSFLNDTAASAANPLAHWLSQSIDESTDAAQVAFFLLPSSPGAAGPPVAVRPLTVGTTGAGSLPDEMALCLSYQAGTAGVPEFSGSTRPRARRRNRTYLGPLNSAIMVIDSATKEVYVTSTAKQDVVEASRDFLFTGPATDGWSWEAVSKTEWTSRAVFDVWCDNAFDVQRRRGVKPTVRYFVTL